MDVNELVGLLWLFVLVLALYLIIHVIRMVKILKSDDKAQEVTYIGRIIEKTADTKLPFDWITIECINGTRHSFRNVNKKEIILAIGDDGTFTVRGQTIYAFSRKVK